jgi:hypothetical protein
MRKKTDSALAVDAGETRRRRVYDRAKICTLVSYPWPVQEREWPSPNHGVQQISLERLSLQRQSSFPCS